MPSAVSFVLAIKFNSCSENLIAIMRIYFQSLFVGMRLENCQSLNFEIVESKDFISHLLVLKIFIHTFNYKRSSKQVSQIAQVL